MAFSGQSHQTPTVTSQRGRSQKPVWQEATDSTTAPEEILAKWTLTSEQEQILLKEPHASFSHECNGLAPSCVSAWRSPPVPCCLPCSCWGHESPSRKSLWLQLQHWECVGFIFLLRWVVWREDKIIKIPECSRTHFIKIYRAPQRQTWKRGLIVSVSYRGQELIGEQNNLLLVHWNWL